MINLLRAELLRTFSSRIMLLVAVVGLAVGCWSGWVRPHRPRR